MVVGGTTDQQATFVAKVTTGPVRVAVATDAAMTSPAFSDSTAVDADSVAKVTVSGLDPNTRYWWQVEDNSVLDTSITGQFVTHPPVGSQASFTVAVSACAGASPETEGADGGELAQDRISNHAVFDTIRQRAVNGGWLGFYHLGDLYYYDLGSGDHGIAGGASVANFRTAFDDVMLQPRQHQLYREVPWAYVNDNHDFTVPVGGGSPDGTHPDKANFAQVYRERVPHYPLSDSGGVWQAWQIGRVQFVLSDIRYYRSPNSDPDTSSKTMLGTDQKTWLTDLLTSSQAEVLVWLMPEQWLGIGNDSWDQFQTEREELLSLLGEHGWLDRMVMVYGDRHALGITGGGTNGFGAFPIMQAASLDSSFPVALPDRFDVLTDTPGRGQYGTVTVTDGGDEIDVLLSGWRGETLLGNYLATFTITEPSEPAEPGGLAQVATAQIRTRLTWLSCDLASGQVITELPDLQGAEVSRVIGEYTSASLSLPIPAVGGRELSLAQRAQLVTQSTEPARTMIVPVVNDVPTAGFIPLTRDRGTDASVQLGCVSLEGYLRHRYVRDHLWEGVDPAEIAIGLFADAEDIAGNGQGLNLIVDAPDVNLTAGRYYQATDDETVYGALSELMDAGLLEWTIDVDWRDGLAYRIVDKIARVRLRLGLSGQPTAVFQSATFSSQGASDARYTLKAEHGGDRYGNWIVARGTGEGEDQPRSSAEIDQDALDAGAPIWEQRIQPDIYRSPLFTEAQFNEYMQEQLELHAQQELSRIRAGGQTLEITARWDAPGARYGIDWQLGDDVLHELKGHAHPDGFDGVKRAIGFALSIQAGTIRPILQEEF